MILFSAGVLTFIACWSQISSGDVYHVYSINDCKHKVTYPCTISDYAFNTNLLESGHMELIVTSGTHMLNEVFNISNTDNFSMHSSAVGETPLIKCVQGVHFNFVGVRNLNISSLNFANCSRAISQVNGITSNQFNMSSGLYFHNVVNLTLKSISVSGTKGYGAILSNIYCQVMIKQSYFQYSYDSEDFQGGNMRISYYDTNNLASNMTTNFIIQDGVIAQRISWFNNLSSGVLSVQKFHCHCKTVLQTEPKEHHQKTRLTKNEEMTIVLAKVMARSTAGLRDTLLERWLELRRCFSA